MIILATTAGAANAAESLTVSAHEMADEKAVYATVESVRTVTARTRIGGTVAAISVREGDRVETGAVIATIVDDKLALQLKAADSEIAALQASLDQARTDLARVDNLVQRGVSTQAQLDNAKTALSIADNNLKARTAARAVTVQQASEGNVLAPTAGRVLSVPVTEGAVMLAGETVATIAEQNFVLRLEVPERHARFLKAGDPIRMDGAQIGVDADARGTIELVYPQIEDGRVRADAAVTGLGDYFVGERVRVWVSAGVRPAIVIPADYVTTRFGVDTVQLQQTDGTTIEVPVQRGATATAEGVPNGLEILSGLHTGDVLVKP
ncbi:efflux RND transporter periplasmic adaptor subunit [Kaistia dalseonensis]|uniref:RND family efflux transporter MFP subunit n=1 Tax=Kaistia dalseonensis TaxID=410840 RepID=A0ABU0H4X3_9HYPH|nr:efflux RND transporter periplasmic adaptor subunit [Kaistia dalseonensis]MCX5494775.1 efflux RND transporter periplasmic adaptor subunit [Kaistia dalseonensis]MDQ0437356.1 RND family efflux transporter MFP subunit [Kaistia dalseonensis]